MDSFNELVEYAKERSRAIVEAGERHAPMMLVLLPDDTVAVWPLPEMDRDLFKNAVANVLRTMGACAYVMVQEAWESAVQDEATLARLEAGEVQVSDLPADDRRDILMIVAARNGQPCRMLQAEVSETPQGRRLGDWWEAPAGGIKGRMVIEGW